MPTPTDAAFTRNAVSIFLMSLAWSSNPVSHEFDTTEASGWCPLPLMMARSVLKPP